MYTIGYGAEVAVEDVEGGSAEELEDEEEHAVRQMSQPRPKIKPVKDVR